MLGLRGWPVAVAEWGAPREGSDAWAMRAAWRGPVVGFAAGEVGRAGLVIDAVFGAGLRDAVPEGVSAVSEGAARVLVVDAPSGLEGGTGQARGAVRGAEHAGAVEGSGAGAGEPYVYAGACDGAGWGRDDGRGAAGRVTIAVVSVGCRTADVYRAGEAGVIVTEAAVAALLEDWRRKVRVCGPGMGVGAWEAACAGVFVHGRAAQLTGAGMVGAGMVVEDLLGRLGADDRAPFFDCRG